MVGGAWVTVDEDIVNADGGFRVTGSMETAGDKRIDLILDKKDAEIFNQVEISIDKAHLAMLYTSDDGMEFTRVFDKPRYVKNTILPVGASSARYVKITFFQSKQSSISEGAYQYSIRFNHLNVLRSTLGDSVVFETNEISMPGAFTVLALSTCDNYSDKDVDMSYQVSVDGGSWNKVRPVDKTSVGMIAEPVTLKINDYVDNKLVSLTEFTSTPSGHTASLELPSDLILSNDIRVFAEDITCACVEWKTDGSLRTVYGYLKDVSTIDIGPSEMQVNGKWATGVVEIQPGLYQLRVREESYANLFNGKNAEVIHSGNGEYSVTDADGGIRIVADPLYPYNQKLLIEDIFDLLFYDELIEKDDYTLYNGGSGYNLSTSLEYDEVMVSYRVHRSNVNSLKVRAEMASRDKTTIPYIERILIRMS